MSDDPTVNMFVIQLLTLIHVMSCNVERTKNGLITY